MLSGRYQIMWSHSHLMWFLAPGYSQLIWSQKPDVIGSCDLCYRAATTMGREDPDVAEEIGKVLGGEGIDILLSAQPLPVDGLNGQSVSVTVAPETVENPA